MNKSKISLSTLMVGALVACNNNPSDNQHDNSSDSQTNPNLTAPAMNVTAQKRLH